MLEMHLITDSLVYPFPYNYKHVAPKIRCSQMQFNGVNNKEHQRSLVYSAVFMHMHMPRNSMCSSFQAFLPVL